MQKDIKIVLEIIWYLVLPVVALALYNLYFKRTYPIAG